MIFDTHAHYDDRDFDGDREELIESLPLNNVTKVVNVGASIMSSYWCLDLCHKYDHIYAAIGVHPSDVYLNMDKDLEQLFGFCSDAKVVAIGEIGLDYHFEDDTDHALQREYFIKQLYIAQKLKKSIIIHSRDAAKDTLDILKENYTGESKTVMHCFSYSEEVAKEILDMGLYIGIGGVVTFKNARKMVDVVKSMPLERLLIETDCPYLAPTPHRGKRNSSLYLPLVIEKISEIRGISPKEVEEITYNNAMEFYGLSDGE